MIDFLGQTTGHLTAGELALRLVMAALLAGCIGIDRELRTRNAGLRTHMLISLAAASFTIAAWSMFERTRELGDAQSDPIRTIEAVTAGVAFIAAGAIFRGSSRVHGLTTGAGMWTAGAIGMACGAGLYALAVLVTAISVAIITVLGLIERHTLPEK